MFECSNDIKININLQPWTHRYQIEIGDDEFQRYIDSIITVYHV